MRPRLSESVKSSGHLCPVCSFTAGAVSRQQTYMQLQYQELIPYWGSTRTQCPPKQTDFNVGRLPLAFSWRWKTGGWLQPTTTALTESLYAIGVVYQDRHLKMCSGHLVFDLDNHQQSVSMRWRLSFSLWCFWRSQEKNALMLQYMYLQLHSHCIVTIRDAICVFFGPISWLVFSHF